MFWWNAKAWIFDLDGTLVDNMGHHERAWVEFFRRSGHPVDVDALRNFMSGKTAVDVVREFMSPDLSVAEVQRCAEEKENIYRELYGPELAPLDGLFDFLKEGKRHGITLVIGSAARRRNIDFVLNGLGITDLFAGIVSAENIARGKPDPEVFLKAAAIAGAKPSECLVFEDARFGLEAAQRAGMPAVLLTTAHDEAELRNHPAVRFVADSFLDLTRASSSTL